MKRTILALLAAVPALGAIADITVNVAPDINNREYSVEYGYISDMVKPRQDRPESKKATFNVSDGKFVIKTLPDGAAQYVIPANDREYVMIYTEPGDNIDVNLTSLSPLAYTMKGSKLMEDIASMDTESDKLLQQFRQMQESGNPTPEAIQKIQDDYNAIFRNYIKNNPTAKAVPFAVMHLDGEDFLNAYNAMTPEAKESPIALFLEPQRQYVERAMEAERKKAALMSGNVVAPNFTFKDIDGKEVSLSDFRGKWVVIDFWGSWCRWCIKGFPELKEAYKKFAGKLEILGVACNDPRDAWEAAVKKYDLPWVNVYNPEQGGGQVLTDYGVEGFPTKAIVSPDGIVKNITTGDNPEFYNLLDQLIK